MRTPERFIEAIGGGRSAESASETLDAEARRIEGLQLSLRTTAGVPVEAFDADDLTMMNDLLSVDGGRARLTRAGRLLANEVALRLR